jgi:hypothetical protein
MMADYDNPQSDIGEGEDAQALDLVKVQEEWAEKIEKRQKDFDRFKQEADRSIKWLRLGENDRKNKARGDKLNIAWANYEILRSSTYSRAPKVVVVPRFGGGDKRTILEPAAQVLERVIESNNDRVNLHAALCKVRDDLIKVGRGVPWVRYEPTFEQRPMPVLDEATGQPQMDETGQMMMAPQDVKVSERVVVDPVPWADYLEGPADLWDRVPWVAKRVRMTKKAFAKRFGPERAQETGVSFVNNDMTDKRRKTEGNAAEVWEIWCKESKAAYWIVKDAKEAIEVMDPPPLELEGFFPCPEPAMSNSEDGSRFPISDVIMIEDQLTEIDALTKRIDALRESLRVRGFYSKGSAQTSAADQIEAAIKNTDDRQVIVPVPAWAANGQGKISDLIVWLPLDMVVTTIQQCTAMRKEAIELVYQVTGISDVMRGASQASETLGAQQIKAQWGSVRVQDKQSEMQRVARDLCRIVAEIVCNLFSSDSFEKMAVYGYQPDMEQILRDDLTRSLVIDIETDSTISTDEDADKAKRMEFLTSIGGMIQQALPVVQAAPEIMPVIGAMMKFAAQGFRVGREMEGEIDKAMQAIQQRMSQPQQPPQPDPTEQLKSEATQATAKAAIVRANADIAKTQMEMSAPMAGSVAA